MIGQTISHYKILEKLGEGGMGAVYKAEDFRLGRPVALKFLAQHLVASEEVRRRFLREARTAATLNHPNICAVYEVDEADGHTFISMACLEGRELAAEIADGPIEPDRAVHLAMQFTEGLAEAHAKGIVHRDIKPANLFVTQTDRGLILDFGLAQLTSAASKLTREGMTVGTIAYMSPEQAQGAEVDARTDVWAMGCVLYEMLAGQAPFRGDYEQAIVYWILNEEPDPLDGVPSEVESIVRRCLSKDREERFADGAALRKALLGQGSSRRQSASRVEVPRVAVLPLKTSGGDAELESFAEGLTEELTGGLAQFRHLAVVSASLSARYGGPVDTRAVGKELGACFLIEGSVRRAGLSLRASIRLVDATTGDQLWSERLGGDLGKDDILDLQDQLTDRIVATFADSSGVLTRSLAALVKGKPLDALTADECVLLTFAYWEQVRPDLHAEARTALELAVKREPRHSEAMACLSRVYLDEYRFGFNALADPLDRALRTGRKAVEIDPTSQNANRSLAEAHYYRREFTSFLPVAERVLTLNPRDTNNVAMTSQLIAYGSGDWAKGRSGSRSVMNMNPHHSGWLNFIFVWDHLRKAEYEQALKYAEKVNMPGYWVACAALAAIHAHLGNAEAARKNLETFLEVLPMPPQYVRQEGLKWFSSAEVIDPLMDGLRKAGFDVEQL